MYGAPLDSGSPLRCARNDDCYKVSLKKIPAKVTFWIDYSGPENKNNAGIILDMAISLADEGKTVYILMEKILVHGLLGQKKYDAARKSGVKFLRTTDNASVDFTVEADKVKLYYEDITLPGMKIFVYSNMLVIPEKIAPPENTLSFSAVLIRQ